MVPCRVGAGQTKYRNLRGFVEVGEDLASRKRKSPETGDEVAAGPGFEPGLSDSESVSIHPWLFTAVQKSAFSSQLPESRVSGCSPSFTPVTVRSLSRMLVTLCFPS